MRFVDASVFVHAYLKPKRTLSQTEVGIKEAAKRIVSRLSGGEEVLTSVVHLAEVANILEDYLPSDEALAVEEALLFKDSIVVAGVSRQDCLAALQEAGEEKIGLSDAIALRVMKKEGVSEIYSFDKDFDRIGEVTRISG